MSPLPHYVIVDVDTGTDDAWALAMLLKAEKTHNIKVLAVTTVSGNTSVDHVVTNTARVLECYKRTDNPVSIIKVTRMFKIPVYRGAVSAFIESGQPETEPFHGVDGFGDIKHASEPNISVVKADRAANAMHRLVMEYPKQVSLICCGPTTNVALAIKLYPDFADNIKDIRIMGGNYQGSGNTIRRSTEFNFFVDTEAAHIVINSLKCPITLLPWESVTTQNLQIETNWRFDVLGAVAHPFLDLMNPVERAIFLPKGLPTWPIVDALLVATMLFPERLIRQQAKRNCDVELNGTNTRGMMCIDYLGTKIPNVTVIELLHTDAAKKALMWTVNSGTWL